jgi:hypothetical protein
MAQLRYLGYSTTLFNCLGYAMVNDDVAVSDEFEKIWKEVGSLYSYWL